MQLLIADDEFTIRKGLESLDWSSIGVTVCYVASDGREALKAIQALHPDIILTDIRMPGLSGIEIAQYVYEHNIDCQVIFLSGYNDFEYVKSAIVYGVFDYVLKPSDPDDIFKSMRSASETLQTSRMLSTTTACACKELETLNIADTAVSENQQGVVIDITDKIVHDILNFIEKNYMKDISLKTLSNEIHYNSTYICRILKKKTGHTFSEVLMAVRMFHAAQMLATTGYNIPRVAEEVGIRDYKYFSQVFKKTFNLTPVEYRKRNMQGSIQI